MEIKVSAIVLFVGKWYFCRLYSGFFGSFGRVVVSLFAAVDACRAAFLGG